MAQIAEFTAQIINGRPGVPLSVDNLLRKMEGKPLHVVLEEPIRRSSNAQLRYYFSCIVTPIRKMFFDHGTNMTKEETHEWLKRYVGKLFREIITPDGEATYVLESYRKLPVPRAELYHLECRQWAAERGLDIAEPNEETMQ